MTVHLNKYWFRTPFRLLLVMIKFQQQKHNIKALIHTCQRSSGERREEAAVMYTMCSKSHKPSNCIFFTLSLNKCVSMFLISHYWFLLLDSLSIIMYKIFSPSPSKRIHSDRCLWVSEKGSSSLSDNAISNPFFHP